MLFGRQAPVLYDGHEREEARQVERLKLAELIFDHGMRIALATFEFSEQTIIQAAEALHKVRPLISE